MEARFSMNQPWNFGYTPKQYFATLSPEQKERFDPRYIGFKGLDELHCLTATSPPARRLILPYLIDRAVGAYDQKALISALVLTNCKPFGEISYDAKKVEEHAEIMVQHELKVRILPYGTTLKVKTENPKRQTDRELLIGFSDEVIKIYLDLYTKFQSGIIAEMEMDVIQGILFGYPIADVFAHAALDLDIPAEQRKIRFYPLLQNVVVESEWSSEWRQNVGKKGLEHLARVHSFHISGHEIPEESPYAWRFSDLIETTNRFIQSLE